jgi:hypothetical protein
VYLHTHCVKQFWVVQYLEADLKTPLGRMFHYTDLNFVRDILARKIADCLRCDFLPKCYMAPMEIRQRRRTLRYRKLLVRQNVQLKNKINRRCSR